jgi:hypothetical protein
MPLWLQSMSLFWLPYSWHQQQQQEHSWHLEQATGIQMLLLVSSLC